MEFSQYSRRPNCPSHSISLRSLSGALVPPEQPKDVEMVEAKSEEGGSKLVPKYRKGASVVYRAAHEVLTALILDVHLDDLLEPYYTIRLPDGIEKQTDNAHIMLPDADKANDDNIRSHWRTAASKDGTQATYDHNHHPQSYPTSTNRNGFQSCLAASTKKERGIDPDPSPTNPNGYQYRPCTRQHRRGGGDPKPAKPMHSKSFKRASSSPSNTSIMDLKFASALENALQEKSDLRCISNTDVADIRHQAGAVAARKGDVPEVIKLYRPNARFRRSKTLDAKPSLATLDVKDSPPDPRNNGGNLKSRTSLARSLNSELSDMAERMSKPSSIERQKMVLANIARERRSINSSDFVSTERKKMLLEKERMLLEKLDFLYSVEVHS